MSEGNVERLNEALLNSVELRDRLRTDPFSVFDEHGVQLTDLEKQILNSEKFTQLTDDDLLEGLRHPRSWIPW
jgi:hypothetical protein